MTDPAGRARCNDRCRWPDGCPVMCEQQIPKAVEINQIRRDTERLVREHDDTVIQAVQNREPITILGVKYVPAESHYLPPELAHDLFLRFCDHQPHVSEMDRWEMAGDAVYKVFKPYLTKKNKGLT